MKSRDARPSMRSLASPTALYRLAISGCTRDASRSTKEVLRRLRPSRRQVHTAPFPRPLYSILLSPKTHVVCDSHTNRQSPIGDHGPSPPNSPMRSRHNILLSALSSSTVLSSSIRTFFLLPDTLPWDPSRASIHSVVPGAQQSAYSPRPRPRFLRSRVHISQGAFPFAGLDSVAPQDPHPLNPRASFLALRITSTAPPVLATMGYALGRLDKQHASFAPRTPTRSDKARGPLRAHGVHRATPLHSSSLKLQIPTAQRPSPPCEVRIINTQTLTLRWLRHGCGSVGALVASQTGSACPQDPARSAAARDPGPRRRLSAPRSHGPGWARSRGVYVRGERKG
ncbi:hypothetical protein C8Q76DRAFT_287136 [Earliella scabrosa]|nr:hypothetical protein C8Q76DRAFT_287136 [Earliella scabrosa]